MFRCLVNVRLGFLGLVRSRTSHQWLVGWGLSLLSRFPDIPNRPNYIDHSQKIIVALTGEPPPFLGGLRIEDSPLAWRTTRIVLVSSTNQGGGVGVMDPPTAKDLRKISDFAQ